MPYDTIFNYSRLCHCLHSFQLLQQNAAWILLTTLSLTTQADICWSANAECRDRQTSSHRYLLTAEERGALCPVVVLLRSGGERSCPMMDSYHVVFGRTISLAFFSWPPQTLHRPAFRPRCPCTYHLPWVWCPSARPSVPTPPSTLALVLLPLCCSPPHLPSSSSLSNSYNHCPSLYSSMSKSNSLLFPPRCTGTHSRPLSCNCREEIYSQPFYLETDHREISVALSWNMPGLDGIFRCQNLTSLYRACANCEDSNA